jgi:flagellar biosynthesis GTPase FlhF
MLQDPDGFRSAVDRDDEAAREARRQQEEEDEAVAKDMDHRERQVEQDRQRQIHEEQLRRARAEQEAEARRMREELERSQKIESMKRRQQEEALSLQKVQATTKPCPGCRWPIEKNRGCSHMTCKFINDSHPSISPICQSSMNWSQYYCNEVPDSYRHTVQAPILLELHEGLVESQITMPLIEMFILNLR